MSILGAEPCTLIRYASGTRDATGRYVEGAATSTPITGAIQPMPGRMRQALPEGLREKDGRKILTEHQIRPASHYGSGRSADQIVVDGITYDVVGAEHWRAVVPHYQGALIRVDESFAMGTP